jgi:hypothetical protein
VSLYIVARGDCESEFVEAEGVDLWKCGTLVFLGPREQECGARKDKCCHGGKLFIVASFAPGAWAEFARWDVVLDFDEDDEDCEDDDEDCDEECD